MLQVVYQLVFANNRNISHAAGEFLHKKLLSEDLEEVLKEHRAQRHTRKIREPHIILKELLRFFLENEVSIGTPFVCIILKELLRFFLENEVSIGDPFYLYYPQGTSEVLP